MRKINCFVCCFLRLFFSAFAGAEPSPALLVASTKKRARKGSKDVPESKETSPKTADDSALKNKGRGRKPKPKPGNASPLL